ncbi:hypothetical protein WMF38_31645 [Sorangium sp. So ce118]
MPILTLSAVTYNEFTHENVKFTVADPSKVKDLWLEPDDLLVERSNTPELVGTAALFPGPGGFAVFPDLIIRVRIRRELNVRYVAAFLSSEMARQHFRRRAQGIAGSMPKIDQAAVEETLVPLAPLEEQVRILAAIEQNLSDIDAGVSSLERVLANLKRYRVAVLRAACEGRLVPTEAELARKEGREYEPGDVLLRRILAERRARWEADQLTKMKAKGQVARDVRWKAKYEEPEGPDTSDPTELPEGWTWAKLDTLLRETLRNGHSARAVEGAGIDGVRTLTLTAVTNGVFGPENTKITVADSTRIADLWLEPGDILVQRSNTPELVGTTRRFPGPAGFAIFPDLMIRVRVTSLVQSQYVELVLRSERVHRYFRQRAQGIAGSMPKIDQETVAATAIMLPPIAEQRRIVIEVDRLLSVADELERTVRAQLARAQRLRQSVLKHAFQGKLVPQNPNDEPASVLLDRICGDENTTELKKPRRQSSRRRAPNTEMDP